jgi:predicted dehydrogenase
MKKINIAIIGYKFMGRAHSNAWLKAPLFFDTPVQPVLKVACGRHAADVQDFADKWGWQEVETDWRKVMERDDIDVIDIATPQHLHHEIAVAAAKAGKHIFCEKPMAMDSQQAQEMLDICEQNKVLHYLNHNYRRVPAIALAKKWIDEGKIGRIYHWRCAYQQDWITDPAFPLSWQLRAETAKAGPHWDLHSHCVDLAQYLVGKIVEVTALTASFISQRPLAAEQASGNLKAGASGEGMGEVTVEDAAMMMVRFAEGAVGSFEATRFANGRKNRLTFELYGSNGSLVFDLENLNELHYYDHQAPEGAKGFTKVLTTEDSHPYVQHWWPAGHILGYEHTFVHAVADFLQSIHSGEEITPNFRTGLENIRVLEAGLTSAQQKKTVFI